MLAHVVLLPRLPGLLGLLLLVVDAHLGVVAHLGVLAHLSVLSNAMLCNLKKYFKRSTVTIHIK